MAKKNYYKIAEDWCKDNEFVFIGIDSILKGNRIEVSVGIAGDLDKEGRLKVRHLIVPCGRQEVEIERYNYNVIRNDNEDGTDGICLYNFSSRKDAVEWIQDDFNHTRAMLAKEEKVVTEEPKNGYWVFEGEGGIVIDWSIRKLPIQWDGTWTDPCYPVKYHKRNWKPRCM